MDPLFTTYPILVQQIDRLSGGAPWCVTGASVLLHDADGVHYFELTKPKHWSARPDGAMAVGIGGIGGSLEEGETVLECVQREAREEVLGTVTVESA